MQKRKRTPIEIYNERASQQDFCHLNDISDYFVYFILNTEDLFFYAHNGINIYGIRQNLRALFKERSSRGGSTITQQTVKNLYFTFERSWSRKLKEAFLSLEFERQLSKNQILELYLNIIYFDNGQYGISNASRFYFGRTPKELTFNQSIFLSVLPPVAGIYNPLYHQENYAAYRNKRMYDGFHDERTYKYILAEIQKHDPDCLDEELCHATKETDPYNSPGPMINERFGPGMPESLIYKKTIR